MTDTPLQRFLGGPPAAVATRLLFVSLVVGALMMWLGIEPFTVFEWLHAAALRLWATGFEGVAQVGRTLAAGAAVVVPVWLAARVLGWGASDRRRTPTGRWSRPADLPPNGWPDRRD